jgi:pentatricopeptide repeat protein
MMSALARRSFSVLKSQQRVRLLSTRIGNRAACGSSSSLRLGRYVNGCESVTRHASSFAKLSKANEIKPSYGAASVTSNDQDTKSDEDTLRKNDDDPDAHRYQEWHSLKQQELRGLSSSADEILTAVSFSNNEIDSILELMMKLRNFNTQITPELHSLSHFRRKHPMYPPSDFMAEVTFEAAAKCQTLLAHLLAGNNVIPTAQVKAYKLCMETWSNVYHLSCGDRSEDILEAYGERFGGDMDLAPNLDCYKIVLRGYNRSCSSFFKSETEDDRDGKRQTPGEKASDVLDLLTSVSAWDLYLKPDLELYSYVLSAIRNTLLDWRGKARQNVIERKKYDELATKAMGAFKEMEMLMETKKKKFGDLSLSEWNCIIQSYSDAIAIASKVRLQNNEKLEQSAEDLLLKLEDFVLENADSIVQVAATDGDSTLLKDMQRNIEGAYVDAIASKLHSTMKRRGHFDNLSSALQNVDLSEEIFLRMKDRSQALSPFLFPAPTQDHYGALLECVCECLYNEYSASGENAMRRLEELPHTKAARLLAELEEMQSTSPDFQPIDGSIYSLVIWAQCQVVLWKSIMQRERFFDVADTVENMLEKAEENYNESLLTFSSSRDATIMYNSIFRFYSKRSKNRSGGMASKLSKRTMCLLDGLERWNTTSGGQVKPDDVTFNLIIKILSDNGLYDEVESVHSRMRAFGITPNEKHYHAAMRSLGAPGDCALKAESILNEVKGKYSEDGSAKPTTALYTSCISSFGSSAEHNKVAKILGLTKELNDLYVATKDEAFKPDMMFYSAVLDALSKSKDDAALDHALRLLDELENKHSNGEIDTGPNRITYTTVLHAIAKSSKPNSAKAAEDLMNRMIQRSNDLNDDSLQPDKVTYTALIQALANNRQVDRAEKWFREMKAQYLTGNASARPNKMTFTALINCWGNSKRPEASERATELLAMMEEEAENGHFDSKPDAFVYSSIIKLLSKTRSDDKATRVWRLYEQMRSKYESGDVEMKPNNVIVSSDMLL